MTCELREERGVKLIISYPWIYYFFFIGFYLAERVDLRVYTALAPYSDYMYTCIMSLHITLEGNKRAARQKKKKNCGCAIMWPCIL